MKELLKYRIEEKENEGVKESIQNQYEGAFPQDWENADTNEMRNAISKAATFRKQKNNGKEDDKSWFKRIDHGVYLGSVIVKYLGQMNGKTIKSQVDFLSNYMDDARL